MQLPSCVISSIAAGRMAVVGLPIRRADYSARLSIPALKISLCIGDKPSKVLHNAFEEAHGPSKLQGPQQSTDL